MLSVLSGAARQPFAPPARAPPGHAWHVVSERCDVRAAADPDSRVLRTLRRGDPLEVDQASSLPDETLRHDSSPRARLARKQSLGLKALRVLSPQAGWCAASQCCVGRARDVGHAWRYVVVCRDGAYVRRGLELASTHAFTLPKDAVFEVRERRVNEQGLARLRTDDGWISADLNPLSGQRGPVAEPLPVAAPLTFRVVLRDGAVVRETVELSSAIVSVVPCGRTVEVTAKQYSDHPALHCVPRLRVEGPARGWISQRLNREPPRDLEVVELVGVAEPRDQRVALPPPPPPVPRRVSRPALAGSGISALSGSDIDAAVANESLCVVCLTDARNATFVHGETGHIACCLLCARTLQARGDSCPVCRMPIDVVIQHFFA